MLQSTSECYICNYCKRSFSRKFNLLSHIQNCHMNSSCSCVICGQRFGRPAGLQLHLRRGHNRNLQPYPECDLCGRIFTRKQNIASHMITVHSQGQSLKIQCKFCLNMFCTEKLLKRHLSNSHNPDVQHFNCEACSKTFKSELSLNTHLEMSRETFKCQFCGKVYCNNQILRRHVEVNHRIKGEFKCDLCPKVYNYSSSLRSHTKSRHSLANHTDIDANMDTLSQVSNRGFTDKNASLKFICTSCNQHYEEESKLRNHIKSEHSFQIFYEYCKNTLLKQEKSMLNKNRKENSSCSCEYCSSTFANVFEMKNHMKVLHDKEYNLSTCNVCFTKLYSMETVLVHKRTCLPPPNVNACNQCNKLFTDISSLQFHTRVFHSQTINAVDDVTSNNLEQNPTTVGAYKCTICTRAYYSDRSLKHHIKLKHTTDETVKCNECGKVCNNKYYLSAHIKMVHKDKTWCKCDYCDKQFTSERNIRRHIEYTHLGVKRYKCIECGTLFKEKRSLRKHVRTKHPHSKSFPQCHICLKRFESAKSCKIHLKLLHSFNMNSHPCGLCSVSFSSYEDLKIHLRTKHLDDGDIYKCEECNIVFNGHVKFEKHIDEFHENLIPDLKKKGLPRCIICMKDFSTHKTLKRHIKNFHNDFDYEKLALYGTRKRVFNVDCENCIKLFCDDFYYNLYLKLKHLQDPIIFKCDKCLTSYNSLEYAIQRCKLFMSNLSKSKMILSELCTTEMSDGESSTAQFAMYSKMKDLQTTNIKVGQIKSEPTST